MSIFSCAINMYLIKCLFLFCKLQIRGRIFIIFCQFSIKLFVFDAQILFLFHSTNAGKNNAKI